MADEQVKTVRIVIDASKAKDGAADVEKALKSIDDKIAALGDSVGRAFGGLKNVLLGFLSFDAILTQVRGLTEAFDRLGTKARTLGTTTDWLQAFEFALASNTVKIDEGYKALERFTRLVGEGAQGNKAAVEVLDRLGVKIYDINRQVRPVSDLFEEASRKIGGMRAGAEQNTLAIQAMGKTATAVIPALESIGKGSDAMIKAGEKAGAIVGRETVKIWEDLATRTDQAMIKWRAFAGENFAESVGKAFELIARTIGTTLKELNAFAGALDSLWGKAKAFAREQGSAAVLSDLPEADTALATARGEEERRARLLATAQGDAARNPTGAAANRLRDAQAAYDQSIAARIAREQQRTAIIARGINLGVGSPDAPPPVGRGDFGLPPIPQPGAGGTTGAYGARATDTGAQGDRLNKRTQALEAEVDATKRIADAARQGAVAVNAQEAAFKALQQALEVYGAQAAKEDPKVKALAERFKELNQQIADNKAVAAFRLQTEDLDRQNLVLEKRLELIGAAPEVVAREVAVLQVRNEVAKSGVRFSEEDIAARAAAVEQQELLNQKLQQAVRTQELWAEPLKQAFRDIQRFGADTWFAILDSGKFTFESLKDFAIQTFKRVAAEFLALATIRPIMSVVVNAISPSMAQQMGMAAGMSMPGFGGGGMSMPSMGGFGGGGLSNITMPSWLGGGQPLAFLNQPIGGFGSAANISAASPASQVGPAGASGASLGGITWGQGLGAAAGIGMGAFQLATSKSTAQTIGGVASMVGAGVSLIPGFGQIAGPLIALAGNILPGLFGGNPDPVITNQTAGQLRFGGSGFFTTGGAWGPDANASSAQGPLGQVGASLQAILNALGGVRDPSQVWGLSSESIAKTGGGWNFNSTSTFLQNPNGGQELWRMNMDDMLSTGGAQVAMRSILGGAVGEISTNMRTALESIKNVSAQQAASIEQVAATVSDIIAFDAAIDDLGKTVTPIREAILGIDQQFAALYATASKYGLGTGEIDKAVTDARQKVLTDFSTDLRLATLDITDPATAATQRLDKERTDLIAQNDDIVEIFGQSASRIVQIEEYLAAKRVSITERALQQTVSAAIGGIDRLQDLIREFSPGGAHSNLDPAGQYAGLRATYNASYAQARANPTDAALIDRSVADALAFGEYSQRYYAGSPDYNRDRDLILQQAQSLQHSAAQQLPGAAGVGLDPQMAQAFEQLTQAIVMASGGNTNPTATASLLAKVDQLINVITNLITNGRRAA